MRFRLSLIEKLKKADFMPKSVDFKQSDNVDLLQS